MTTGRGSGARRLRGTGVGCVAAIVALAAANVAQAAAPSGAIFTTLFDGSEVNFNIYPSKESVYLDGGPGPGAPQDAAGLDDGVYVFQVTSPSGKVLLSTDAGRCRQFIVGGGVITAVVASGCEHVTGFDLDHGATTVQLFPYDDTPNNGGVYKVWATLVEDYLEGCALLGVSNGLDVVDCGYEPGVATHGFIPAESKTDNFKVKDTGAQEIDARFYGPGGGRPLLGLRIGWTDPTGASNKKWSYHAPELQVFEEAHIEAVTAGTHTVAVKDQPGCVVGAVRRDGNLLGYGERDVPVRVSGTSKEFSIMIRVSCR